MSYVFSEQYSYKYLNLFRKYNAKFDKVSKTWTMKEADKEAFLKDKDQFDLNEEIRIRIAWSDACLKTGHKFARKGTPEYDEFKTVFKRLLSTH